MRYIAFDALQRYCQATELSEDGKLRHFRFSNTREAWACLWKDLSPDARVVLPD